MQARSRGTSHTEECDVARNAGHVDILADEHVMYKSEAEEASWTSWGHSSGRCAPINLWVKS